MDIDDVGMDYNGNKRRMKHSAECRRNSEGSPYSDDEYCRRREEDERRPRRSRRSGGSHRRRRRRDRRYDNDTDDGGDRYYREDDDYYYRERGHRDHRSRDRDDFYDRDRGRRGCCECGGRSSSKRSLVEVKTEVPSVKMEASPHYTPMPTTVSADEQLPSQQEAKRLSQKKPAITDQSVDTTATPSSSRKSARPSLLPTPKSLEEYIEKLLVGCRMERNPGKQSSIIVEILGMYKILGNPSEAIKAEFDRKIHLSDRRFSGYDISFAKNFEHIWSYALIEYCMNSSKANKSFLQQFVDLKLAENICNPGERCSTALRFLAAFCSVSFAKLVIDVSSAEQFKESLLTSENSHMRIIRFWDRYHIAICGQSLPVDGGGGLVEALTLYVILYFYFSLRFPEEWREFLQAITALMGLPLPAKKQLNGNIVDIINGAYQIIQKRRSMLEEFKWSPTLLRNTAPPVQQPALTPLGSVSAGGKMMAHQKSTGSSGTGGSFSKSAPSFSLPNASSAKRSVGLLGVAPTPTLVNPSVTATDQAILNKLHKYADSGVSVMTAASAAVSTPKILAGTGNSGVKFSGILPTSIATNMSPISDADSPPHQRPALSDSAFGKSEDDENDSGMLVVSTTPTGIENATSLGGFPVLPNGDGGCVDLALKKIKSECYENEEQFIINN